MVATPLALTLVFPSVLSRAGNTLPVRATFLRDHPGVRFIVRMPLGTVGFLSYVISLQLLLDSGPVTLRTSASKVAGPTSSVTRGFVKHKVVSAEKMPSFAVRLSRVGAAGVLVCANGFEMRGILANLVAAQVVYRQVVMYLSHGPRVCDPMDVPAHLPIQPEHGVPVLRPHVGGPRPTARARIASYLRAPPRAHLRRHRAKSLKQNRIGNFIGHGYIVTHGLKGEGV